MTDDATSAPLTWLRGDLHNHCEDHDLIEAHLEGAASEKLDFIALTNHAQKPVFFEQHRMIDKARSTLPELLVFFGLEWNAPGGIHAGLIFPPGEREAENAYAFARAHDRLGARNEPSIEAALEYLGSLPLAERPLLFFNHPAPGQWSAASIDRYIDADPAGVVAGIEALLPSGGALRMGAGDSRRRAGIVRLRLVAQSHERPAPGPPGPKHFLTSAILLDADG